MSVNKSGLWFAIAIIALAPYTLLGQNSKCGTTEAVEQSLIANPELRKNIERLNHETSLYLSGQSPVADDIQSSEYTIPVVVHIIHNYGPENISEEQVIDAIRILNEDFNKLNPDTNLIASAFVPLATDSRVQFKLASLDPQGAATQGITRTQSNFTFSAGENVKSLVGWPTNRYLNVWVVSNIASGAGGYAYYPGTAPSANNEGIVVNYRQFGSTGGSGGSNFASRTLTHEVGHFLNLMHPWGNSNEPGLASNCNIDDGVDDTPNTEGVDNQGCNKSQVTCGSLDNVENYMDYSNCGRMFTHGQGARMRAALNSTVGARSNLWTTQNLALTGVNYTGDIPPPAKPIADFLVTASTACLNSQVRLKANVYNAYGDTTLSVKWSCPDTALHFTADTLLSTNCIATKPGFYNITITAMGLGGTTIVTKQNIVRFIAPQSQFLGYINQGFEGSDLVSSNFEPNGTSWLLDGPSQGISFSISALTEGSRSLNLNLPAVSLNSIYTLQSPLFDISASNANNRVLTFDYAFAQRNSNNTDRLEVSISTNCGQSWTNRITRVGANLSTTTNPVSGNFLPTSSQWRLDGINLAAYVNEKNAMVRFTLTNGGGNRFYLDNIKMGTPQLVNYQNSRPILLSPNPLKIGETVQINLTENVNGASVIVFTLEGKRVFANDKLIPTNGLISVDFNGRLSAGIYLISIETSDIVYYSKLILTE